MKWKSVAIAFVLACSIILGSGTAHAANSLQGLHATLLATGLEEAIGSTIGPDGALYVAQGTLGTISRVDPQTGDDHDVRQRSAETAQRRRSRWGDGRRVHRQDRVCTGHPRQR